MIYIRYKEDSDIFQKKKCMCILYSHIYLFQYQKNADGIDLMMNCTCSGLSTQELSCYYNLKRSHSKDIKTVSEGLLLKQ